MRKIRAFPRGVRERGPGREGAPQRVRRRTRSPKTRPGSGVLSALPLAEEKSRKKRRRTRPPRRRPRERLRNAVVITVLRWTASAADSLTVRSYSVSSTRGLSRALREIQLGKKLFRGSIFISSCQCPRTHSITDLNEFSRFSDGEIFLI